MTIAILDDNETVLWTIKAALEQLGYAPVGFSCPDDLAGYLRNNADVCLMICDQLLESTESGWNIARSLRDRFKLNIPVLMVTAYPGSDLVSEINSCGFASLLRKPFGLEELANSVTRCLKPAADR